MNREFEILNPLGGWLVLILLPILLLHLRKKTYRREVVSTMMFWRNVFEEHRDDGWGRWVRFWLPLGMSLLFVILLLMAILNWVVVESVINESATKRQMTSLNEKVMISSIPSSGTRGSNTPVTIPAARNIMLTRFQPRRTFTDPVEFEILVEVVNQESASVSCRLEVELNENLLDILLFNLLPNQSEQRIIKGISEIGGILRGKFSFSNHHTGKYHPHQVVEAPLTDRSTMSILCWGVSNYFLVKALEIQPQTKQENIATIPSAIPFNSILVMEGEVPEQLPDGNVLLINPTGTSDLFSVGELLQAPLIGKIKGDSPLLRFVTLENLLFSGAKELFLADSNLSPEILAETIDGKPLFLHWYRSLSSRVIVLTVDLEQSELAFKAAFPLLIANILKTFRAEDDYIEPLQTSLPPIDTLNAPPPLISSEWQVTTSAGLFPADAVEKTRHSLWFYFGFGALLVSLTEWFLYHRCYIN